MAYSVNDAAAESNVDAFLSTFQTGGVAVIFSGTREADSVAHGSLVSTVLATIPLGVSAFEAAGATTPRLAGLLASINDPAGDANGNGTWFRVYDNPVPASAVRIWAGDVGALTSGADMELDDGAAGTAITTADVVTIASLNVTM